MANIQDLFYHGIRQQIRRVLVLLGEERTDKGLTAFEDGSSDWSHCFFARALAPARLNDEWCVARELGIDTVIPIRIVYRTFDGQGRWINRDELKKFIEAVRDESRPSEVMELLKSIDYKGSEDPLSKQELCNGVR